MPIFIENERRSHAKRRTANRSASTWISKRSKHFTSKFKNSWRQPNSQWTAKEAKRCLIQAPRLIGRNSTFFPVVFGMGGTNPENARYPMRITFWTEFRRKGIASRQSCPMSSTGVRTGPPSARSSDEPGTSSSSTWSYSSQGCWSLEHKPDQRLAIIPFASADWRAKTTAPYSLDVRYYVIGSKQVTAEDITKQHGGASARSRMGGDYFRWHAGITVPNLVHHFANALSEQPARRSGGRDELVLRCPLIDTFRFLDLSAAAAPTDNSAQPATTYDI